MMTMSDNNQKIDTISSFLSNGYDQLISILTSENKLCERKLIIFNNKRIEEENKKLSYMRKIAKSKQLEEAQSLDPANFRNQKNFQKKIDVCVYIDRKWNRQMYREINIKRNRQMDRQIDRQIDKICSVCLV